MTEVAQSCSADLAIDERDSGSEFDWYCFAELVDQLVDVIHVEHDQEHTDAAMWCEHPVCVTGRLWSSFPGLLEVADQLVAAVRAEHDREHAAPFGFCNHALCRGAKCVWEAKD